MYFVTIRITVYYVTAFAKDSSHSDDTHICASWTGVHPDAPHGSDVTVEMWISPGYVAVADFLNRYFDESNKLKQ